MSEDPRVRRDLEQLKRQAKELLRSANSGNLPAIDEFKALRLTPSGDGGYQLAQAQLVIARRERFESWQKLRTHIERQAAPALFDAIRDGNLRRVKQLLREFPQLMRQKEPSSQMLPVQMAAYEGRLEIVELLVHAGANPTEGDRPVRMQTHALHYAEARGHVTIVRFIRQWLAKRRGHTEEAQRLCTAIKADDLPHVEALLEQDDSLANATEFGNGSGFPGGDPVLHFAISNDRPEAVETLVAHGANLHSRCRRGRTPIQTALGFLVGIGHRPGLDRKPDLAKRMQIVEILLDAGAERDLWVECCMGNLAAVESMIHADPDSTNRSVNRSQASGGVGMDHYPLTGAVGAGRHEIAKLLLENGADPDTPFRLKDEDHLDHGAPMEIAVRNDDVSMVKLLLEHGASPNTSRHACSNAVQTAIDSGNDELLQLLLSKGGVVGFDARLKIDWNNIQNRLLQEAHLRTIPAVTRELAARFIGSATFHGLPHVLEPCLKKIAPISGRLHFELFENVIEMWSLYIGNVKGAKAEDYFECMKLLLESGLDPNAVNSRGETCLHRLSANTPYPREEHRVEFAGLLLEKGAAPDQPDKVIPSTPLDLARKNKFEQLTKLMLEHAT